MKISRSVVYPMDEALEFESWPQVSSVLMLLHLAIGTSWADSMYTPAKQLLRVTNN